MNQMKYAYFLEHISSAGNTKKQKSEPHWEYNTGMITPPRSPEKIHHEISEMLANGVNYIDALCEYARKNDIEIEAVADIVKKSSILKEKLRSEAVKLKMVRRDDYDITELCE
jgi:predicted aldo/keto reductase-like oxidoreductase